MKIAVASGKGGTGKTTVAANLARVASRAGASVAYLDCDVEEPNGHIFLRPVIEESEPVGVRFPRVDEEACTGCGTCGDICRFSAIICVRGKVLVYPELCHDCGGCILACPEGALDEDERAVGRLEKGDARGVRFVHGLLDVGEIMSPPLIAAVKASAPGGADLLLYDAPPGTSCPVIESVRDADVVLLVTEPTPFGLHDLRLAVEMVRALGLPFAVVVNRAGLGDRNTHAFCRDEGIRILAEIPDDRRIAEAYARGELMCDAVPAYTALFETLLADLGCAAASPTE